MVETGQAAVIHFTGRIAEGDSAGEIFDTTNVDVALEEGIYHDHRDYKPLKIEVGEGNIVDGIDRALQEMDAGGRRTIELEPEAAFGTKSDRKVLEVPRSELQRDGDVAIEEGNLVTSENGDTGWILAADEDVAVVDFNHELAGVRIECDLHVLDVLGTPDDDADGG